jgi:enamine deaminase RidA (YjgF/YER057c/UK114 family)
MTPIEHFLPDAAIKPPLSFATRAGNLLFVSGIPGFGEGGVLAEGFEAQFHRVVANLQRIFAEAGTDFRRICKMTVYLTRPSDVDRMNELYATAFGPPPYPARTTCVVRALPDPAMLIEIECIAVVE